MKIVVVFTKPMRFLWILLSNNITPVHAFVYHFMRYSTLKRLETRNCHVCQIKISVYCLEQSLLATYTM